MDLKEHKHITIKKDIHEKLKLYSEVTGMKIYKIASDAIKEYIENHPKDDEQIEDLNEEKE